MAISVSFYNCSNSIEVVNKSKSLIATYNCDVYENEDYEHINILIENNTNLRNANYCYIPTFGRYYNIAPTELPDGRFSFTGISDVLSSFFDSMKTGTQVIARRSSNKYNKELIDNAIASKRSETYREVNMNSAGNYFTNDSSAYSVVLTLQGL